MVNTRKNLLTDLHIFLGIAAAMIVLGFIFVFSSSSVYALEKFGSSYYFVKKQFAVLALGLGALVFMRLLPIRLVKRLSPYAFLGALGLTALTRVPFFCASHSWLCSLA